ncbi:VCBS domain-containing protein, partial [Limibacillus halophilus]|uniref:VCBS domain-containing protein n=1 Tax=Limibacillus halophilus TaxID=1579333 RepID=UPI001C84F666
YTVSNAAVQFLDAGETITLSFDVTGSDGETSDNGTITITINGAADTPAFTDAPDVEGTVDENNLVADDVHGGGCDPAEGPIVTSGSFSVQDLDGDALFISFVSFVASDQSIGSDSFGAGDTVTISAVSGTFTITGTSTVENDDGSLTTTFFWQYELENPAFDVPGVDEIEQFNVIVSDGTNDVTLTTVATIVLTDSLPVGAVGNETVNNEITTVSGDLGICFGADDLLADPFDAAVTAVNPTSIPAGFTATLIDTSGGAFTYSITSDDPSDQAEFVLVVNADGSYEFSIVSPLEGTTIEQTLVGLTPGGPIPSLVLNLGTSGLQATFSNFEDKGGINSSGQGMGVGNNLVNTGELLDISFDNPDTPGAEPIFQILFDIQKLSVGEVVTWSVTLATGEVITGTYTAANVVDNPATPENEAITWGENSTVADFDLLLAAFLQGTLLSSDIPQGGLTSPEYQQLLYDMIGTTGFDEISLGAGTSTDYRLLSMEIRETFSAEDTAFSFDVVASDNDGDSVTSPLTFVINADGDPVATILGQAVDDPLTLDIDESANTLVGSELGDIILGLAGDDILYGRGGADQIFGGNGADVIIGGPGDDQIYTGENITPILNDLSNDTIVIGPGDGLDTIYGFDISGSSSTPGTGDILDLGELFSGGDEILSLLFGDLTGDSIDDVEVSVNGTPVAVLDGATLFDGAGAADLVALQIDSTEIENSIVTSTLV